MSLDAYRRVQNIADSPRETEYRLFAQVTRSLIEVDDRGERDAKFFDAIDWNRRMWSTLSTDCATPGNELTKPLRAQIISIALWVSRHSSQVALGRADMAALIDVNRTIMEGLVMATAAAGSESGRPSAIDT